MRTGGVGSSTDSSKWCSFSEAVAAQRTGDVDGIGFALGKTEGINFAGVDLDDCRDCETGELSELARTIVAKLDTYAEISPSGTGIKLICIGELLPNARTKNSAATVEIYGSGRYFTVTGQRLPGTNVNVESRQEQLQEVWQTHIGNELPSSKSPSSPGKRTSKPEASTTAICESALAAMRRHLPDLKENDGSKRLFCVACRAVEYDLTDDEAVVTIRAYEAEYPFPSNWTDANIIARLRSAEQHAERGAGWRAIDTETKNLAIITPLAWKALGLANDPPTLFRYGGSASRIEMGDEGEPIIKVLDANRMRHHLARAATWTHWTSQDGLKQVAPPMPVVNDVLATPNPSLPILSRIVEAPVFAFDGTLQTTAGYHAASQTFYAPACGFDVPPVSPQPTAQEISDARALICEELLGDFPFVSDAELAHAVALLLLPFARDLILGPTPLHLLEKPSPGTGATLMVDMLTYPAIGRSIPAMTEGRDEDEWRKRITAKLRNGSPFILIDNLRRRLDSAALSAAITATTWEDRVLGVSDVTRLPVRCGWLATGNNPTVSTEIARRTVRIRMDAKMDRPWLRREFRHSNLRKWAADNRGQLVWSSLTLVTAWLAAGKALGASRLGMYERWSEVMGGILEVAGIPGFLTNVTEFYDESDAEGANWREFISTWWQRFNTAETTVKELWKLVTEEACLPLGEGSEQSQRVTLGKWLADRKDRVFDLGQEPSKLRIARGQKRQGAFRWHLAIAV